MKISPSMMCADVAETGNILSEFEKNGVEYLHIDIMDGRFVPNFTLGTDYCRAMKRLCAIPLDIHLMVEEPETKLDWFPIDEGDIVSVHVEAAKDIKKALADIRRRGGRAFIAVNPSTPHSVLADVDGCFDGVLVMAVNPGFAGQKMVDGTLEKIREIREYLDNCGRKDTEIEVDGNVSYENAVKMKNAGANIFVAGTSSVFGSKNGVAGGIAKMRELLGN